MHLPLFSPSSSSDKSTSLSVPRGHYGNRKAIVGVCCRFAFMCCRQTSPGLQGIWSGVIARVSSPVCRTRHWTWATWWHIAPFTLRRTWGFTSPEYNNCWFPWRSIVPRRDASRRALMVTWLLGNPKGLTHLSQAFSSPPRLGQTTEGVSGCRNLIWFLGTRLVNYTNLSDLRGSWNWRIGLDGIGGLWEENGDAH